MDMRPRKRVGQPQDLDALLVMLVLAPVIWTTGVAVLTPMFTDMLATRQQFDLVPYYPLVLTAFLLLTSIIIAGGLAAFLVLDEVDAPLDENNIGRFIRLLQEFKEQTQFVLITHNPRSIEAADWIYGVTMEEPGVSTIVGVPLHEALQVGGSAA